MTRIAGVNVPEKKRTVIALTFIYGIGISRSKLICKISKTNENIKIKNLKEKQIEKIRKEVSKYIIEGDLRRKINLSIKRLIDLNCYRGLRHKKNLPVNGQRTKTNARTRKGPRKIIKK